MARKAQVFSNAYGVGQGLVGIFPDPIKSQRSPTVLDRGEPGQHWIDMVAGTAYIATGTSAGSTTWSVTAATDPGAVVIGGILTASVGLTVTAGGATITAGGLTVTAGGAAITGNSTVTGSFAATTTITAGTNITSTAGNITATNGNVVMSTATNHIVLPGPVKIMSGAGVPANGLAAAAGDMYINTTSVLLTTRLYIATGAGAWTNVTCAA